MSPEQSRGPISPLEAVELKKDQIPPAVFDIFNSLIAQNLVGRTATVSQTDVVSLLEEIGFNRSEIYKNHWLDIEDCYRAVGWKVDYDKPVSWGGENFEPYFKFTKPSNAEQNC